MLNSANKYMYTVLCSLCICEHVSPANSNILYIAWGFFWVFFVMLAMYFCEEANMQDIALRNIK